MSLPPSFLRDGFVTAQQATHISGKGIVRKFRRLMLATEGDWDTGKSEFMLSAPGPGQIIALDKNFDAMLDNPSPPKVRRKDFGWKVISAPLPGQPTKAVYVEYYTQFYQALMKSLDNPDSKTVGIDGDSDSYELQRLAEWGEVIPMSGHPSLGFKGVNAARKGLYWRCWESGKIIIATNKLHDEYATVSNPDGTFKMDDKGKPLREKTGKREAEGFKDQDYLWQIRIRHLYRAAYFNPVLKKQMPQQWGLKILKCKANKALEGDELWGDDCCFAGLVQYVYPNVPLAEWGY